MNVSPCLKLTLILQFCNILALGQNSGEESPQIEYYGMAFPSSQRDDFEYKVELLPGQVFSGYIYHWTESGEAWGNLHENPDVGWLSLFPSSFVATGCDKPVPVKFTFTAPQQPGTYTTAVEDWEYNWSDNHVTLVVTEYPTENVTDSLIFVDGSGRPITRYEEHEYVGVSPKQSWYDLGYCGPDPYIFSTTRKITHALYPSQTDVTIEPSSMTLLLDEKELITKIFSNGETVNDSFYEAVYYQWRSLPQYTKWKLVPADLNCMSWQQIPSLIVPSVSSEAVIYNDSLYVLGGLDPYSQQPLNRVEILRGDEWAVLPASMKEKRYHFGSEVLDNHIYALGGLNTSRSASVTIEYYDGNDWYYSPHTMPAPVFDFDGLSYTGSFYIFGGRSLMNGYDKNLRKFSVSDGWTDLGETLPFSPRSGYRCMQLQDYIYVLGGAFYPSDGSDTTWFREVWRYDPAGNNFLKMENMNKTRADFACGEIDGMIYVAGGTSADPLTASSFEFYDPVGNYWALCEDIPDLKIIDPAVTIKDNQLYLAGGAISKSGIAADYRACYGSIYINGDDTNPGDEPYPMVHVYPNPFYETSAVQIEMPYDSKVTFSIFDISGRLIEVILDEPMISGNYQFSLNGLLLADGFYICRLTTEKHEIITRFVKIIL